MRTLSQCILFLLVMAGLVVGWLLLTNVWSWRDPMSWVWTVIGACLYYGLLYAIYKPRQQEKR